MSSTDHTSLVFTTQKLQSLFDSPLNLFVSDRNSLARSLEANGENISFYAIEAWFRHKDSNYSNPRKSLLQTEKSYSLPKKRWRPILDLFGVSWEKLQLTDSEFKTWCMTTSNNLEPAQPRNPDAQAAHSVPELGDTLSGQVDVIERITTLLIEPIRSLSTDSSSRFLAEGMTEDLIMHLSRNPDIRVVTVAQTAIQNPQNNQGLDDKPPAQYILTGSVAIEGESILLRSKLIDAETNITIWTDKLRRAVKEASEVQSEIVTALTDLVGPIIWQAEGDRIAGEDPKNLSAWEFVHRAIYVQFHGYSRETSQLAESLVRRGIKINPSYALGHSTLGLILANRVMQCLSDDDEKSVMDEALAFSDRAIVLNPRDTRILTGASVVAAAAGNHNLAVRYSRKSVELDTSVGAFGFLGLLMIMQGDFEEGINLTEKEMQLTPNSNRRYLSLSNIGMAYIGIGDYEKAQDYLVDSLSLHPNYHMNLINLAVCQSLLKNSSEASKTIRKMRKLEPGIKLESVKKQRLWLGKHYLKSLDEVWEDSPS